MSTESYKLVLTEHLNHFGFLFGGQMLAWVDEVGYIAARTEYPGREFVTIAMDEARFHHSVALGAVLRFTAERIREGGSSVRYRIAVRTAEDDTTLFSTTITFVCIDADGKKRSLHS